MATDTLNRVLQELTLTSSDIEVLEMFAGEREWPEPDSSWVNECFEYLYSYGYVTPNGLTDKGRTVLERLKLNGVHFSEVLVF